MIIEDRGESASIKFLPLEEEFSEKVEQHSKHDWSSRIESTYLPYKLKRKRERQREREGKISKGCVECKLSNFVCTLIQGGWSKEDRIPNIKRKRKRGKREEKKYYAVKGRLGIA